MGTIFLNVFLFDGDGNVTRMGAYREKAYPLFTKLASTRVFSVVPLQRGNGFTFLTFKALHSLPTNLNCNSGLTDFQFYVSGNL